MTGDHGCDDSILVEVVKFLCTHQVKKFLFLQLLFFFCFFLFLLDDWLFSLVFLVLVDKENLYKEVDNVHIDVNGLPKPS